MSQARIAELEADTDFLRRQLATAAEIKADACARLETRIAELDAENAALKAEHAEDQSVIAVWRGRCQRAEKERDEANFKAENRESMCNILRADMREMHGNLQKMTAERDAITALLRDVLAEYQNKDWMFPTEKRIRAALAVRVES